MKNVYMAPYEEGGTGGGSEPEVQVSEADCNELNAKLGGVSIPPGFPSILGGLGPALQAWMQDAFILKITIDGTTYTVDVRNLDYWTVDMILSLFEQSQAKRARSV